MHPTATDTDATLNEWPTSTEKVCDYCSLAITGPPLGMPVEHDVDLGVMRLLGQYHGWECLHAALHNAKGTVAARGSATSAADALRHANRPSHAEIRRKLALVLLMRVRTTPDPHALEPLAPAPPMHLQRHLQPSHGTTTGQPPAPPRQPRQLAHPLRGDGIRFERVRVAATSTVITTPDATDHTVGLPARARAPGRTAGRDDNGTVVVTKRPGALSCMKRKAVAQHA
jgi:hypothetical protein